jgi:hypothetical protein
MVVAGNQLQIDLAQLLIGAFVFEPKVGQCDLSVNDGQAVLFCDLSLPVRLFRGGKRLQFGEFAVYGLLEFKVQNYPLNPASGSFDPDRLLLV